MCFFLFTKLNILIDKDGHARLADFGLLTIVSDPTNPTVSSSSADGGTTRWMSPELLKAHQSGTRHVRPTKESDCYALGMVVYEVLSGQAPFASYQNFIVIRKVIDGDRPERPEGVKGEWFVGDLWRTLEMCWVAEPGSRPSIQAVSECLEQVPRDWKPSSPQADEDVEVDEDEDFWDTTVSYSSGIAPLPFISYSYQESSADRVCNLHSGLIPSAFTLPRRYAPSRSLKP
jgi:serine/threonine protein kinase